jgi:hypothetical protein
MMDGEANWTRTNEATALEATPAMDTRAGYTPILCGQGLARQSSTKPGKPSRRPVKKSKPSSIG